MIINYLSPDKTLSKRDKTLSKCDNIKTYALREYEIRIEIIREAHRKKTESLSERC